MMRALVCAALVATMCGFAAAQENPPGEAPPPTWQYTEVVNQMTQARSERAYVVPIGSADTDVTMFMVERTGSSLRIIVPGDGNLISCSLGGRVETCFIRVRFDDDPAIHSYVGGLSRDHRAVIISDPIYVNPFLRRVRAAQRMVLQIPYRYQDDGHYTFAVGGLTF